jgi:hypothetical protein
MSSTWRRYANGLVRDDLAAPDRGVNVSILTTLPSVQKWPSKVHAPCGVELTVASAGARPVDPNLTRWFTVKR